MKIRLLVGAGLLAAILVLCCGCAYLTPPTALISGPEVKVEEKEVEAKQPATRTKRKKFTVKVSYPTTGIKRELPIGGDDE